MVDLDGTCDCKIGRNSREYGLPNLDEELVRARREEDSSLRDLADLVNRRILEAAVEADLDSDLPEFDVLDEDDVVQGIYDALQSEESTRRARVETRLQQVGVDVERVQSAWVTHPTVRTHLRDCLDVDTSSSVTIGEDDAVDTIEWARARCEAVVERTFDRLRSANRLAAGSFDVNVAVRVTCEDCGRSDTPREIVRRGGCSCHVSSR